MSSRKSPHRAFTAAALFLAIFWGLSQVHAAVDEGTPMQVRVETAVPPYTFSCGNGLYSTITGYLQVKDVNLAGASTMLLDVPGFCRPMPVVAVMQSHPAPLVVVLPGISGRADSDFSKLWPSWYANAGYHVLTMNSTFRPEFMDISGKGVSGNVWAETEDIAAIINTFLKDQVLSSKVTKVGVVGMSYGGVQALILGKMAKEGKLPFELSAIQAYSPPIKIDKTAELFDAWFNEHRWNYTEAEMLYKVGYHKPQCNSNCNTESAGLSECIMKAALSASFEVELTPVVVRANNKFHLNVLPNGNQFDDEQVKKDYARQWGFTRYAYDLALPFWRDKLHLQSLDELVTASHLCNLLAAQPAHSEAILSADDPFNDPADFEELKQCKHSGALSILPSGGHLGYVIDEWTHTKLLTLFADAPVPAAAPVPEPAR